MIRRQRTMSSDKLDKYMPTLTSVDHDELCSCLRRPDYEHRDAVLNAFVGFVDGVEVYDERVFVSCVAQELLDSHVGDNPMPEAEAWDLAREELRNLKEVNLNGVWVYPSKWLTFSLEQSTPLSEKELTLDEYQLNASRTAKPSELQNWGLGLAGETGEVIELIKKAKYHGVELDKDKLSKELGDVLWYISAIASECGINMAEIAENNLSKLEQRYPDGFKLGGGIRNDG